MDTHPEIEIKNLAPIQKIERIYRILLSIPAQKRSWYAIAKEANVSYGWAYKVLKGLQEKGIINGSAITAPSELFYIWVKRPVLTKYREYHVPGPEEMITSSKLEYALTTYAAEHLLGKYLFKRYYDIYIKSQDAGKWHLYLSSLGYVGKGNVRVFIEDEHVFWDNRKINGYNIVSIQQLIVDLKREGGECTEAADLLLRRFYTGD